MGSEGGNGLWAEVGMHRCVQGLTTNQGGDTDCSPWPGPGNYCTHLSTLLSTIIISILEAGPARGNHPLTSTVRGDGDCG